MIPALGEPKRVPARVATNRPGVDRRARQAGLVALGDLVEDAEGTQDGLDVLGVRRLDAVAALQGTGVALRVHGGSRGPGRGGADEGNREDDESGEELHGWESEGELKMAR